MDKFRRSIRLEKLNIQIECLRKLRQRSIEGYESGTRILRKRGKIAIRNCLRRLLVTSMAKRTPEGSACAKRFMPEFNP